MGLSEHAETRCTRGVLVLFSEKECNLVTVHVCINLTLPQRKSCSVHMRVFEFVVQQLDIIIGMMYQQNQQ